MIRFLKEFFIGVKEGMTGGFHEGACAGFKAWMRKYDKEFQAFAAGYHFGMNAQSGDGDVLDKYVKYKVEKNAIPPTKT